MVKKLTFVLAILSVIYSCQDSDKKDLSSEPQTEKVPDSIQVLTGQFIFVGNEGVLRGEDFVYGVKIDSMAKELVSRVKPYKNEDFDMVPVKVKGKITPNPKQGSWDETIEIQEIIKILADTTASENKKEE